MQLDHLILVAGPDGLEATAARLAGALGSGWSPGGRHPGWGTRNAVVPLAGRAYLEVVEVADRGVAEGTAFGAAVARAGDAGGGWVGWVLAVNDLDAWAARLGRAVAPGTRRRPDGTQLHWRTLGVEVLDADPLLPFLISWDVPDELHPSAGVAATATADVVELAGDQDRLAAWLGGDPAGAVRGLTVTVRPTGPGERPGLRAVTLTTPHGAVRLPARP